MLTAKLNAAFSVKLLICGNSLFEILRAEGSACGNNRVPVDSLSLIPLAVLRNFVFVKEGIFVNPCTVMSRLSAEFAVFGAASAFSV